MNGDPTGIDLDLCSRIQTQTNLFERLLPVVTCCHAPSTSHQDLQDNAITLQNVLVTIKYLIPDEGWRLLFMLTLDQWC